MNERASLIQFFASTNLVPLNKAEEIAGYFSRISLDKNQLNLKEGQMCDAYFFLESGFMRAFAYNIKGDEVCTGFYKPGQMVFEVSSFFNRTRSRENLQALTPCIGWCINYETLNQLFHARPEFRDFGRAMLVKGFAALKDRTLSMITETAEQRYVHLLKEQPDLFQHVPLKYIATYLGITDTSFSRIRKKHL